MFEGLPLITYPARGRGGQASYTFALRITCKKGGGEGVQIACKNAYVINGRPLALAVNFFILKIQDIAIFAAQFTYFSKSVLLMKLSLISDIGTGKISSWTG